MATYTGLDNQVYQTPYSRKQEYSTTDKQLNRILNRGLSGRKMKRKLQALIGAAPGSSQTLTRTRIAHETGQFALGGKRTIETVTVLSGVTTSADVDRLQEVIALKNRPATYPKDKSGIPEGGRVNQI